ncbi:alpha/beta hydrolase [Mesorhizobium sp. M0977]|uniref:alpha/beta fold hydrolase n=1 Tax=Mesorhizobium sp. M0977 TaxID=2957039 RepID=UPI0033395EB6
MFEGFSLEQIKLPEATLRVRVGGRGPPLLMLHGHPRTHATWHRVAPILAEEYTVICLIFAVSAKPFDMPDHSGSSKRSNARDCLALMYYLGFDRFGLAGQDRGAYTAFRTAMDHPASVSRQAIPIGMRWRDVTLGSHRHGGIGSSSLSLKSRSRLSLPIQTHGTAVIPRRWARRLTLISRLDPRSGDGPRRDRGLQGRVRHRPTT